MIIIVDAYNLLHAMPFYKKTITDRERQDFIKKIGMYGRCKKHKMILVFDGGRYDWPYKEKLHSVQVIYSGVNETADDYIKEYLNNHQSKDMLLVSSDGELNACADRLFISSIDSNSFYYLLQEALRDGSMSGASTDNVVKMSDSSFGDIDALMVEASKMVSVKAEDIAPVVAKRDSKNKQVKKQERVLLKKLHKL
jgi:hypothetical protein